MALIIFFYIWQLRPLAMGPAFYFGGFLKKIKIFVILIIFQSYLNRYFLMLLSQSFDRSSFNLQGVFVQNIWLKNKYIKTLKGWTEEC